MKKDRLLISGWRPIIALTVKQHPAAALSDKKVLAMNTQHEENLVTNEFGVIDTNYYLEKAHKLRSEAIKEQSATLKSMIKSLLTPSFGDSLKTA